MRRPLRAFSSAGQPHTRYVKECMVSQSALQIYRSLTSFSWMSSSPDVEVSPHKALECRPGVPKPLAELFWGRHCPGSGQNKGYAAQAGYPCNIANTACTHLRHLDKLRHLENFSLVSHTIAPNSTFYFYRFIRQLTIQILRYYAHLKSNEIHTNIKAITLQRNHIQCYLTQKSECTLT